MSETGNHDVPFTMDMDPISQGRAGKPLIDPSVSGLAQTVPNGRVKSGIAVRRTGKRSADDQRALMERIVAFIRPCRWSGVIVCL